jgi:hypothetical protein
LSMSRGGPSGPSGIPAVRGNPGTFNGGNAGTFNGGNGMSFRGDARMGRMEHDHDRDRGDHDRDRDRDRFRPGFAFGFYPGYDYYTYDNGYDDSCYQWQQVPTRRGWRWARIWVCD